MRCPPTTSLSQIALVIVMPKTTIHTLADLSLLTRTPNRVRSEIQRLKQEQPLLALGVNWPMAKQALVMRLWKGTMLDTDLPAVSPTS